jgi:hypothetical protein
MAPQLGVSVLCPGYVDTNIRTSKRNRPERLGGADQSSSGREAVTPQPASAVRISPDRIADLTLAAIRDRQFYAFADWDIWRPLVAERFNALLDQEPPVPVRLS